MDGAEARDDMVPSVAGDEEDDELVLAALVNSAPIEETAAEGLSNTLKRVAAGGLAGMVAKSVVAPLDRIKILFQVTTEPFSLRRARQLGLDILKLEGTRGLWRGNSATMLRVFPYAGSQFLVFDTLKRRVLNRKRSHSMSTGQHSALSAAPPRMSNLESLVCGSCAGATSVVVTYPLDLARARLAVGVEHHNSGNVGLWTGVSGTLKALIKENGPSALYRGITPTLLGIIPYSGIAFCINERAKHEVRVVTGNDPGTFHKLGIGAFSGLIAQSCTYPLEVMRRRMQTAGVVDQHAGVSKVFAGKHGQLEKLTLEGTLRQVLAEQGVRGLFKGLSMNWVKGPVGIGISFTTFDFLKRRMDLQ
ncbi:unnamed protein product [Chrysoparadoxa australica]